MFKFNILLALLVILVYINKNYFYLYIEGDLTFKFTLGPQNIRTGTVHMGTKTDWCFNATAIIYFTLYQEQKLWIILGQKCIASGDIVWTVEWNGY
jgi:hypothetical protein